MYKIVNVSHLIIHYSFVPNCRGGQIAIYYDPPPRLPKMYSNQHPLILLLPPPHFNDFEVQFGSASIASKLSLFFFLHFISDGQIKLKIFIKIQFCPPPPQPKVLFTLKSFLKCNFSNQKVNRNQKLETPPPPY